MSATDAVNFLYSLAAAIAAAADLDLGSELFVLEANEKAVTTAGAGGGAYAVLRPYGGPVKSTFAGRRYGSASVQVDGRGADAAAVLERLYQVFDALHDDQERPRMHWEIAGKVLDAGTNALADDPDGSWLVRHVRFLQAVPGLTGREQGRQFGTFNFDVGWDRVPAA